MAFDPLNPQATEWPEQAIDPESEIQSQQTSSEAIRGSDITVGRVVGSELWVPTFEAPGSVRARLANARQAYSGIAGSASVFKLFFDFWRSTAIDNTDGQVDPTDRRAGFFNWQFNPLSTSFILRMRGQAAFGDDSPSATQFVDVDFNSGEPASTPGSGTDTYILVKFGNSSTGDEAELTFKRIGTSTAELNRAIDPERAAIIWSFRAGLSGNDTLANNTVTRLDFDDPTGTGNHFGFAGVTNVAGNQGDGRFIVPPGWNGKWEFFAGAQWAANGTGNRILQIRVNGTGVADSRWATIGTTVQCIASGPLLLVGGDVIDVVAQQNSGGNLDVVDADLSFFSGRYVGTGDQS